MAAAESFIVVDEAHVVVQWSENFREVYGQLHQLKIFNPDSTLLALTATASKKMQGDIATSLLMNNWKLVRTSVDRPNIFFSVSRKDSLTGRYHSAEDSFLNILDPLLEELRVHREQFKKTILYCKLFWCGIAYEQAAVKGLCDHVAMYHAHCTSEVCQCNLSFNMTD